MCWRSRWRSWNRGLRVPSMRWSRSGGSSRTGRSSPCWQNGWVGKTKQPPSTNGHHGIPDKGESVRVYMARNAYDGFTDDNKDGGFNVIGGNGFERVKPAGK